VTQPETGSNLVPLDGTGAKAEVLTVDEQRALDIHHEILDLKKQYQQTYFKLAERLYAVSTEALYKKIGPGYSTFESYVETELDFSFRKAKYLAQIWWWYGVENAAHPKLMSIAHEIGWTKARELVQVIDLKNADEWHDLAKSLPKNDLARAARAAMKAAGRNRRSRNVIPDPEPEPPKSSFEKDRGGSQDAMGDVPEDGATDDTSKDPYADLVRPTAKGVAPPTPKQLDDIRQDDKEAGWTRIHLDVTEGHLEVIEAALDMAKEQADSEHKGHLMHLICLHFASFYAKEKTVVLGEWLAQIERLTGKTLVAIDRKEGRIVYGEEFVDEMMPKGQEKEEDDERKP
jgi:hypothetical protein